MACDALIKSGAGTFQQQSAAHVGRGLAWEAKNDPDNLPLVTLAQGEENIEQAIADFSEAIKLDPNNVAAYADRAVTEENRHQGFLYATRDAAHFNAYMANLAASVADTTAAIGINPKLAILYVNRAGTRMERDNAIKLSGTGGVIPVAGVDQRPDPADLDNAIADYTAAIALNPYIASIDTPGRGIDLTQPAMTSWLHGAEDCEGKPGTACDMLASRINVYALRAAAYDSRIESSKDNGNIAATMADLGGEIADYTDAMRVEPQAVPYYHSRADAYLARAQIFDTGNDVSHAVADYRAAIADYTKSQSVDPSVNVSANLAQAQNRLAAVAVAPADVSSQCNKCVAYCEGLFKPAPRNCPSLSAAQPAPNDPKATFCFTMYKLCVSGGNRPVCTITGRSATVACASVVPGISKFAE